MKLSESTKRILKNFLSINDSMIISAAAEGENFSYLRSVAPDNIAVGIAKVPEVFPFQAPFVEFSKFFNCLTIFDDADVDFHANYAIISEGRQKVRFNYSEADQIKWKTSKNELPLGTPLITFEMDKDQLETFKRQSDQLGNNVVRFFDSDPSQPRSLLKMESFNADLSDTTNLFTLEVPDYNTVTSDFNFQIGRNAMKFLPGDYKVSLGKRLISFRLMDDVLDVIYYIPFFTGMKTGNIVTVE
jgi:hypothetical protein